MERLNREYNGIAWVGLYNFDKLSSLVVDELSLYFSHHKITFKGKKAEKVAMIKARIGMLLYDSVECQQPRRLILYQNHERKHYCPQNMDESGHRSRETITLAGTR